MSNKTIKRKAIPQSLDGHNIVHLDCERRQWIERNCGSMAGNIGRLNDHQASHVRVIMGDNDFNEREVFGQTYPGVTMFICLYHALRTFRRQINF